MKRYIGILLMFFIVCQLGCGQYKEKRNIDKIKIGEKDTSNRELSFEELIDIVGSDPITEESKKKAKEDLFFSNDLRRYIYNNTRYPVGRIDDGIEGAVMFNIKFLADSSVKVNILKSLGKEFDDETKRLMQEAWKASYRENKINTVMVTSVFFYLPDSLKKKE